MFPHLGQYFIVHSSSHTLQPYFTTKLSYYQVEQIGNKILDTNSVISTPTIKPFVDPIEWKNFENEIKSKKNNSFKIDLSLKDQNLDNVAGLKDYILNTDNLDKNEVNSLIQKQNLTDIAKSAKSYSGVSDAIKTYNNMIKNGSEDTQNFLETISQTNPKLADSMKKYDSGTMSVRNYATSLAGATLKTAALQATSMAMSTFINLGVSTAISALMTGIDYLINYDKKQEEAFNNAKQTAENYASSLQQLKKDTVETTSKANKLSGEYATLVQGVNPFTNENKSLSTEDYERFLDLNKQLAELFPSLTKNYDENGNAILGLSGDVDTVTGSISTLVEQQKQLAKSDIKKNLKGFACINQRLIAAKAN